MTARSRQWLASCALCAITLLAYANSFESDFVLDNSSLILDSRNSRVHRATAENVALILHHTYWWPIAGGGVYRPVTTFSWLFNYAILGNADRPAGYHWVNLLLHACNVLLVFALARRLVAEDFWPPFLIAAVWAVHPVLTESVTNIAGRADLLAGMTTLAGLLIYLRSTETTGWRKLAWLVGLTAVTTAGVFSKENAIAILGIVALYELTFRNPRSSARGRLNCFIFGCIAMFPAFLAMWWARSRVLAAEAPAVNSFVDNPIVQADFLTGRLTAVKVMAKYLGLLIWPAHLSADYSYAQIPLINGGLADWIAWIVVASVAIGVIFLYPRNKPAFFAAGFAFVALLPTSNLLVPVGTIMAERFLYLPAVGFAVCLTLALYSIGRRLRVRALAPALLCVIAAGFGARTWARNADWRDDRSFWEAAIRTAPLSFRSRFGYGQELLRSDPFDIDHSLGEEERGLAILDPLPDRLNSPAPYYLLGGQYVEYGNGLRRRNAPESIAKYEKARTLLLRSASIMQAQPKADPGVNPGKGSVIWGHGSKQANDQAAVYTYRMLSEAAQGLGTMDESLHWAREAELAGPTLDGGYLRSHDVLLAIGRRQDAIDALIEGEILTSSATLQHQLMEDYAANPEQSKCAISYEQAAPQIDFSCEVVRKQVCSVSGDVIRMGLKAGPDIAARLKNELAAKYGCDKQ